MKSFALPVAALFLAVSSVSAQSSPPSTSTITITPGCPSAAPADVMVTRSAVAVPSCAAGTNATKPMIVSMSPTMSMGMASGTASGMPSQFTGAAQKIGISGALGAVVVAMVGFGI